MKKSDIFVSIVALVLVGAALFGMVALYRNIDDAFNSDETTVATDTNGNVVETEKPAPETSKPSENTGNNFVSDDFYIDEVNQTGYRTIGNVTYFFKVIKPVYNPTYMSCNRCVWIKNNAIYPYSFYEVSLMYSHDSFQWISCSDKSSWYDYGFQEFIKDDKSVLYVTYTQIVNCTNRAYVLSDLNANVFSDSSIFDYDVIWAAG